MTLPRVTLPKLTDHGSEIALLGFLGFGVVALMWHLADKALLGAKGVDIAAMLLVLQRIVDAITTRWQQRSVDRMGQQLGASQPLGEAPQPVVVTNTADAPVQTETVRE